MILSADTNIFLYAVNPDSPHHEAAQRFFATEATGQQRFLLCGLILVEIYMQLRNPAVFKKPRTAKEAAGFCQILRGNPAWEYADYEPNVAKPLWQWAARTTSGFRHIIDARLAYTLCHHGVTHFATANAKHFGGTFWGLSFKPRKRIGTTDGQDIRRFSRCYANWWSHPPGE